MTREATNRILEMVEDGTLDRDLVITACLKYMSEADVADMAHANEFFACSECSSLVDANEQLCDECKPKPLRCETNTPDVESAILAAFIASDDAASRDATDKDVSADFEHGQWFVTHLPSGAQWSVSDLNDDDFCFEQVSQGTEE